MKIPKETETRFHEFCENCPVCDLCVEGNDYYASNELYERDSVISCKFYEICGRLKKAGIIK